MQYTDEIQKILETIYKKFQPLTIDSNTNRLILNTDSNITISTLNMREHNELVYQKRSLINTFQPGKQQTIDKKLEMLDDESIQDCQLIMTLHKSNPDPTIHLNIQIVQSYLIEKYLQNPEANRIILPFKRKTKPEIFGPNHFEFYDNLILLYEISLNKNQINNILIEEKKSSFATMFMNKTLDATLPDSTYVQNVFSISILDKQTSHQPIINDTISLIFKINEFLNNPY